ncbi:MAG: hypothetical protein WCZ27_07385 [Tissierellaceae bacterium]
MDLIEKVEDMTNDKLGEEILLLNSAQLKLIKEASHIAIFSNLINLRRQLKSFENMEYMRDTRELKSLDQNFRVLVEGTRDLMGSKTVEGKGDLEGLMEQRQGLIELSSLAEGYYIELSYAGMLLEHQINKALAKKNYRDFAYEKNLVNGLIDKIHQTLTGVKDDYEKYAYIISQVIKAVPMRLVKNNFYDVVKESLVNGFVGSTQFEFEKHIKKLKKLFDSSLQDGYGTKFDYYFQEIHRYRNIDFSSEILDQLIKIVEDIKGLEKEILDMYNLIVEMGMVVNKFIVIALIPEDFDSPRVKDLYSQWTNLIEGSDEGMADEFIEKLEPIGNSIQAALFGYLEDFGTLSREAANRDDFDFTELNEIIENTSKVLMYFGDMELIDGDILSLDNKKQIDGDYLSQSCDSLIKYVNRSIRGMSNIEGKIRMRNLLSSIELPFRGIDAFLDYVSYSLDIKVTSNEEINLIADYLYYILDHSMESHE